MMAVRERLITIEEFEAFLARPENQDHLFELVNGEIVEKMPTWEHGVIANNAGGEFYIYFKQNPIGRSAVEARHRPIDDDLNDRLPDVSVVLGFDKPMVRQGAALFIPDLIVEIKSPSDSMKKMLRLADFYLANGATIVWLVYPEKRLVEVLTNDDRKLLDESETLDGGDVLPGFSLRVSDLFRSI